MTMPAKRFSSTFLDFIRYRVSLSVSFSGFAAAVIHDHKILFSQLLPVAGIFLLASGASALNQLQERDFDALMERTRLRPLPALDMKPAQATWIMILVLSAGFVILGLTTPVITVLLGLYNILWYNGIYTYLKRKTSFAVIPGALTGAIPIMMGWTAMGGSWSDPVILFLCLFMFIWQVPHFWLLAMIYHKDYKNAGFPVLTDLFSEKQLKNIILAWIVAASVSSLTVIMAEIRQNPLFTWPSIIIQSLLVIINTSALVLVVYQFYFAKPSRLHLLFHALNLFMLLILMGMTIISIL